MANYNDSRFTQVEDDKKEALSNLEETYGGMIESSDKFYQDQINASKQWAEQQSQIQQEQTDFAIAQLEQQKAQAQQNYIKEQSGAYVDWKKQSNQYGAESEKMAAAGLAKTGYSESSQVSMYNTYQNRVASAKQSIDQAVVNYNNSINQARLQNNAALAEIAANALQQQLELSLQGFQYKNSLIQQKEETRQAYENIYYQRYLDVLNQINTEAALAEQRRQANMSHSLSQQQLAFQQQQYEDQKEQDLIVKLNGIDANQLFVGAMQELRQGGKTAALSKILNPVEFMRVNKLSGDISKYKTRYYAYLRNFIRQELGR